MCEKAKIQTNALILLVNSFKMKTRNEISFKKNSEMRHTQSVEASILF